MAIADDWAALNDSVLEEFADGTVTYAGATVSAVVDGGDDVEGRSAPGVHCSAWFRYSDVATSADGDTVVLTGVTGVDSGSYRVVEIRPDGVGGFWADLQYIRS